MISLDFLKKVDIFKGLNDDQIANILDGCREKHYKNEETIFKEGEPADHIWVILEGKVDIRFDLPGRESSNVTTFYSESSSMTFGWSCFVPPYQYILSAYCGTKSCKLAEIDKKFMLKLFERDPKMGYIVMFNLAGVISTRFHQMQLSTPGAPALSKTRVIVHMATCGIAAGARDVMNALMDEMDQLDRQDIQIESAGCIGKCSTEPNVTIEIEGEEPVIYEKMSSDKIRKVFKEHVLNGKIINDYILS